MCGGQCAVSAINETASHAWFYDQKSRYDSELANFQRKLAEWKTAVHKKEADKVAKAAAKVDNVEGVYS